MGLILTLTMNPAVDICAAVERIFPGHKLRCRLVRRDAGGGGINVARVIRRLGGDPVAVFPAGGPTGQLLERLVADEGVSRVVVPIAGDTREDFTIDENATADQYRFVLPGPLLTHAEERACLEAVDRELGAGKILVASGSLPPSVEPAFYRQVAEKAHACGTKFVLDSSGVALKAALGIGVHLIKPSLREFEQLAGKPIPDENARLAAARNLIAQRRCEQVALSLGEDGALLVGADFAIRASAPRVEAASTVGAGDSFLGALVWAMARQDTPQETLRFAVAAGSAAMLSRGTGLCSVQNIERLARQVEIFEAQPA